MKAAIGYVRVSSESQVDGVSLEMQTKKIQAWCDLHDHCLLTVYEDAGISGKTAEGRPGLQAAIEACDKGGVLVVYSLSRLARSAMDALNTRNRLEKKGAAFVSITESLDTSTSLGRMVFTVLAAFAEFERDEIVSRVKAGMKQTKERGELVGAVPFGYSLATDGKTLVVNPDEQRAITSARRLRASGLSLRKIAAGLDKAGLRSRNGKVFDAKQVARLVA